MGEREFWASAIGLDPSLNLSVNDLKYRALAQATGLDSRYSLADLSRKFYQDRLGINAPDKSINDLEYDYYNSLKLCDLEVRRNLATNPCSVTAYTRMGSSTSTVTLGTTAPPSGFTSYTRMTGASTGWSGVAITPQIATVPGETITASALVRSTTTPGATARVYILFYNSAGTWLSETPVGTVVGSDFARISQTGVVPAGAAFFAIQIRPPDAWGTTSTLDVTGVLVEKVPVLLPYFDGTKNSVSDLGLVPAWTGPVNNSPSILVVKQKSIQDALAAFTNGHLNSLDWSWTP